MIKTLLVFALVSLVFGHAKLNVPTSWNPQPSKTSPCGGGSMPTTPAANWQKGSTTTLVWQVIASDGVGPITVQIDTTGQQSFTNPVTVQATGTTPTVVGTYNFAITVPSVTCTGTGGECTLRVFSSSNWFSCSSVLITDTGGSVPLPSTCVVPTTNSFCTMVQNKQVLLPGGQTVVNAYDTTIENTFNATLNNPLVFSTPNANGCYDAYKTFFCGINYPLCTGQPAGCYQSCVNAVNLCGITDSHNALYNCTRYTNTNYDATGTCPQLDSFGIQIVPSIVLIILLLIIFY